MTDETRGPHWPTMDRRRTIQLSGLLATGSMAALAGCGDEGPGDPEEEEPMDPEEEEPADPEEEEETA
ncbi:hypothetical protein OB905_07400 [Halobacteria archaeon AArc-dxtr1]|nr:hypothetical protein [Halobacteria archaeon AArc-dxtr1]